MTNEVRKFLIAFDVIRKGKEVPTIRVVEATDYKEAKEKLAAEFGVKEIKITSWDEVKDSR